MKFSLLFQMVPFIITTRMVVDRIVTCDTGFNSCIFFKTQTSTLALFYPYFEPPSDKGDFWCVVCSNEKV